MGENNNHIPEGTAEKSNRAQVLLFFRSALLRGVEVSPQQL